MKLAAAVLLVLAPSPAQSSPVTLSPTHDTFVRTSSTDPTQADLSFGNVVYLSVENNSGTMERSYLEFDTTSLAGQTIASAALKVWVIRDNSGGGFDDVFEVYPVFTAWADSLTYNQSTLLVKGALAASSATVDYPSGNPSAPNDTVPPQAVTIDLTTLVQSWASGSANEGIVIQFPTSANADYRFGSLDNPDPALRPTLTVTASSGSPPPPPPPSAPSGGGSTKEGDEGLCGALGLEAILLAGLLRLSRRRLRR